MRSQNLRRRSMGLHFAKILLFTRHFTHRNDGTYSEKISCPRNEMNENTPSRGRGGEIFLALVVYLQSPNLLDIRRVRNIKRSFVIP